MDELSMAHSAQVILCKRIQNGAMKEENFLHIINGNYCTNWIFFTKEKFIHKFKNEERADFSRVYYYGILSNAYLTFNIVTMSTGSVVLIWHISFQLISN